MKKVIIIVSIIIVLAVTGCSMFKKNLKNFDYDVSADGNCVVITVTGCPE